MHRIKTYMDKIIENNNKEDMIKVEELFYKAMCKVHMVDPEMSYWIKDELRELAYGMDLTEDMVEEVLHNKKWNIEETDAVKLNKVWSCDSVPFNYLANVFYNMYYDIIQDENKILEMAHKKLQEYPHSAYYMWKQHK